MVLAGRFVVILVYSLSLVSVDDYIVIILLLHVEISVISSS